MRQVLRNGQESRKIAIGAIAAHGAPVVRAAFGPFVLDAERRQLVRSGREVHLSPKAFDLLCALVERRPGVVPKADLFQQIWPDTFVVDANLNVLVAEIRRALGDDAQAQRFIRTAHGVGYAFRADAAGDPPVVGPARCWLTWKGRTFALAEGEHIIGRDPSCAIWLDHDGVSRRHARIHVAPGLEQAVLDDLGSTNGTFIGDRQISEPATLQDGDVIKVGAVPVKFRAWSDRPAPTRRLRKPQPTPK
jgi:hypothetical protein